MRQAVAASPHVDPAVSLSACAGIALYDLRDTPTCPCGFLLKRPAHCCPLCGRTVDAATLTHLLGRYLARGRCDDPRGLTGDDSLSADPWRASDIGAASAPVRVWVALISFYQTNLSRYTGTCVYYPSCSEYAALAAQRHGVLRAVRLTAARLLRCRWPYGGVEFPPET